MTKKKDAVRYVIRYVVKKNGNTYDYWRTCNQRTGRSFDKWSDIHKEAHDTMSYPDVVSVEIREAQGSVTSLATPVIEEPLKGRKGKKA